MTVGRASYQVYVSAGGNVFMTEIAEMLVHAIDESGRETRLVHHGLPQLHAGTINLVVAPHEYFTLVEGVTEPEVVRAARHCVTVGVEQPGTPWFEWGARYASYGPFAIDVNRTGVAELRRRGLEAYRLAPGYFSGWDVWGGDAARERGRDVVALASITERRAQFLARSASVLAQWECDLRLFYGHQPVRRSAPNFLVGRDKHEFLSDSRVLLNVHQGERDYFEWIRVLEAMSNGCVVVSETSAGHAPLVPGQHFVQAPLENLMGHVDSMLRDEDRRAEMASDAYEHIRKHLNFTDEVDRLLLAVEKRHGRDRFHTWVMDEAPAVDAAMRKEGRRRPLVGSGPARVPAAGSAEPASPADRTRLMIKELMLSEIAEARTLESLICTLSHGTPEHVVVTDTPAYADCTPEVTVLITHYNYPAYVNEAVESVVAAADGVQVDLVLVDDHSDPGARAGLDELMESFHWFPIRLIASSANRGPSGARNLGAGHARGDYLFLLDADNSVYPKGLRLLHRALVESEADFAYGLIEEFGNGLQVRSAVPWDVEFLLQAPYVDAMAMIRRSTWEALGGYDPQADLMGGWDDYEFWLHMAATGGTGVFVPQFVARYRAHGASWQSVVNLDTKRITQYLRTKHAGLPWPATEGVR